MPNYEWCFGANHAWAKEGATEEIGPNQFRVAVHCPVCDGDAWLYWSGTGRRLRPRTYRRSEGYRAYLAATDSRADARMSILAARKPVKVKAKEKGVVRLKRAAGG
jgi:hypothetical protein